MIKAYKYYYNEKEKLVELLEFLVKDQCDFSNEPETNFAEGVNAHNINHENALLACHKFNDDIARGKLMIQKCKDCGIYFLITKDEKEWFESRNLFVPKRCCKCRIKRKYKEN